MDNEKNLPWREDEIVFLEGDWEIFRSETPGLYRYRVKGIEASNAVDAVQLIDWGMAQIIRYSALEPWAGSNIRLLPEAEVLRDLTDRTSPEADRRYFLVEGKKLKRVNRFYLVSRGYAEGNEAFSREVNGLKLRDKPKAESWPDDDIFIVGKRNREVSKGVSVGVYCVSYGGVRFTCRASRLLEEGIAVKTYDRKLEKASKHENFTFEQLAEALGGFWLNEHPEQVQTLHDVARLRYGLTADIDSPALAAIEAHDRAVLAEYAQAASRIHELKTLLGCWKAKVKEADKTYQKLGELVGEAAVYELHSVTDDDTSYLGVSDSARDLLGKAAEEIAALEELLDTCAEGERTPFPAGKPFPAELLPDPSEAVPDVREKLKELGRIRGEIAVCAAASDESFSSEIDARRGELAPMRARIEEQRTRLARITDCVTKRNARRLQLDEYLKGLRPAALNGRPSVFRRPWKQDNIRFTTAVKVRRGKRAGEYLLPGDINEALLPIGADDLCYLGLAKVR